MRSALATYSADLRGRAVDPRIAEHDALFWHVLVAKIPTPRRCACHALFHRTSAGRITAASGAWAVGESRRCNELVERGERARELHLELRRIDALRFRNVQASSDQLEWLLELPGRRREVDRAGASIAREARAPRRAPPQHGDAVVSSIVTRARTSSTSTITGPRAAAGAGDRMTCAILTPQRHGEDTELML